MPAVVEFSFYMESYKAGEESQQELGARSYQSKNIYILYE